MLNQALLLTTTFLPEQRLTCTVYVGVKSLNIQVTAGRKGDVAYLTQTLLLPLVWSVISVKKEVDWLCKFFWQNTTCWVGIVICRSKCQSNLLSQQCDLLVLLLTLAPHISKNNRPDPTWGKFNMHAKRGAKEVYYCATNFKQTGYSSNRWGCR